MNLLSSSLVNVQIDKLCVCNLFRRGYVKFSIEISNYIKMVGKYMNITDYTINDQNVS